MKISHTIRIKQCLLLAQASSCHLRSRAAILVDPERGVISEGVEHSPFPKGRFCGSTDINGQHVRFCLRDGIAAHCHITDSLDYDHAKTIRVGDDRTYIAEFDEAAAKLPAMIREWGAAFPPHPAGTRDDVGCHHAEMNALCNAAKAGLSTDGSWVYVTDEPCLMCAKHLHAAGVIQVMWALVVPLPGSRGRETPPAGAGAKYLAEQKVTMLRIEVQPESEPAYPPTEGPT